MKAPRKSTSLSSKSHIYPVFPISRPCPEVKVFQGLARDSPVLGEVPSGDRVTCGSDQNTKCGREILMSPFRIPLACQ